MTERPQHSGSEDLPEVLRPFAFLLGTWRGEGVGGYPTLGPDFRYGEEITFAYYGKPLLEFHSESWAIEDGRPLSRQTGFWRPLPSSEASEQPRIEVVLALASGL